MSKKIFIFCFLFSLILSPARFSQAQLPPATQAEMLSSQKGLEKLKQSDPKMYQKMLRSKEVSTNIQKIIASYRRKELSLEQAKKKLYPFVEKNLKDRLDNIDTKIAELEQKLENLKKARSDSSPMIEKEIEMILGIGVAMPMVP
ncbi:MAG: hypothetical protein KKH11_01320 [Candidatus Omnitrophica bacterium]|nr:hypothetical protein [Candidatus Omnitrophota bacterium]MBU4140914.1 hypothetical protein [Candidatus Omnitrophota bacterium]